MKGKSFGVGIRPKDVFIKDITNPIPQWHTDFHQRSRSWGAYLLVASLTVGYNHTQHKSLQQSIFQAAHISRARNGWKHLAANHTSFSEVGRTKQTAQFFFQASVVTTLKAVQATIWVWCHRRHGHWTQTRSQRGLNEVQTRSREWLGQGMAYHLRHVYS